MINSKFFRITVLGGGCAGFQYKFDFENSPKSKDDIFLKQKKFNVLIDSTFIRIN